ncbi:biosynthetic-type acetolactate synthase large subunit [Gottschalkiaceae bacterium SANA]|nr:biosynthetic-type acetolactate synthase large subunit [Gottschalkiaceae bacterium SANA]
MKGAEIVLEVLKRENVELMFGYPGATVIPLYDALYRADDAPRHIRTVHEQHAVHAADGYARASGKPGVCLVTSGPGASNTITGLANAYMDSIPMVVITGQVPTSLLGQDAFQELDITGITFSITKHSYLVRHVDELAQVMTEAFKIACSGRPGPVLVDIPKDIFLAETRPDWKAIDQIQGEIFDTSLGHEIKEAVQMIKESERPIILAGGGVRMSGAEAELVAFAEKTQIPIANSLMGLATIDRANPLSIGMIGMHGHKHGNLAVTQSDLILAIGTRFSNRVVGKRSSFGKNAKIIHIDLDPTEFGKVVEHSLAIPGDVKAILTEMTEAVSSAERPVWLQRIRDWQNGEASNREVGFTPKNILRQINQATDPRATLVTDVGQHQMWTAQYWDFKQSEDFITSGGLGTMGFGAGAAIGASMAKPGHPTILITGDGSFRMSTPELLTIARYQLPIFIVVMNNRALGMVRQWQYLFGDERYAETDTDETMSFEKLAAVYDIPGATVSTMEELQAVMDGRKWEGGPFLMEVRIEKTHQVYPMVSPGKTIDHVITEKK